MKAKRVGEIDILRFVFSVIVMLRHGEYVIGSLKGVPFPGGAFAVEFFFLVSGYLMMASIEKVSLADEAIERGRIGEETRNFIWRKLSTFYPEFIVSMIIGWGVVCISGHYSFVDSIKLLRQSIPEMLLLQCFGFWGYINAAAWYLSAMLISMAILYPLIRKYKETMVCLALPLISLFILGYMFKTLGHLRGPQDFIYFTFKGNLRGLAEISMGAMLYPIAQRLSKISLNRLGRILCSVVKWGCYLICIRYMTQMWDNKDFIYLFVFALAIMLSFSRVGIDSNWFNGKFSAFLGKFSLAIYLGHAYWSARAASFYPSFLNQTQKIGLYLLFSVVTAFLIMTLAGLYRKNLPKIKIVLHRLLVKS